MTAIRTIPRNQYTGKAPLAQRFWMKVKKTDGCWLWMASVISAGYGCIRIDGQTRYAHHVAYELVNGKIPDGRWVLHSCDNPRCVRPSHLWLGTHTDNMRDCHRKGRGAVGERHGNSKLTENDVRKILASKETIRSLGAKFGVSHARISDIKNRKAWKQTINQ